MNINNLNCNDKFHAWSESRSTRSLITRIVSSQFPLSTDTKRVIHRLKSLRCVCVCVFEYVLWFLLRWNTLQINLRIFRSSYTAHFDVNAPSNLTEIELVIIIVGTMSRGRLRCTRDYMARGIFLYVEMISFPAIIHKIVLQSCCIADQFT